MAQDTKPNLELVSLFWLDNTANDTEENREMQDKLRSVVNHLKTFDTCQQCEDYLREKINVEHDKIILLVSGRLGPQITENVRHLKQVLSIFVYCMDRDRNKIWSQKYKKVRNVITEIDDLLKEIELDRKSDEHKLNEPIEVLSDKDHIIPMLLKIDYSLSDKRQFLNICWNEYQGNTSELANIQDFEHLYLPSNALNYFFKETFLYRLLIKALQIFNIDLLFLLRFFLQDIEQQLKSCPVVSAPVYRGQLMTTKQIEFLKSSINKDNLRFNSFIIAKKNRDQVLKSLQNAINRTNLNSVLFHIEINQIGKQFQEFILFPITTQFRIISIDYQNEIYIVKIVVSTSDLLLNKSPINAIELGHRLRDLGRLNEAEKIFDRLSSQLPKKNSKLYDGLARIAQDKGLYEDSLELYEKSLSKSSSKDRPHCLNNIGCIYDYLERYDQALEYYSKALYLMKNEIHQAMCINNIGIILANQKQYENARQSFQQSLSIRERLLPENHPDIGISHTNIGVVCSTIYQSDLALEHYQKALKIFSQNSLHIYKAVVYQNIAQIFYNKNQFKDALNYYQQAETIFLKTQPSDHPNLIYIEQTIDQLRKIK